MFVLLSVFCFSLVGCGRGTSNVNYSKEFSYLPAYSSDMKADTVSKPNEYGFITANYTIKNTTNTEVFQNYEDILKKNGWTIDQEQKPYNFIAKKDNHQAIVALASSNKDVKVIIMSK